MRKGDGWQDWDGTTPVLSWTAEPNALWYQVYLGTKDGQQLHFKWRSAVAMNCASQTCTLPLSMILPLGEYVWYMQAWGPGGFSIGGTQGWAFGPVFTVELPTLPNDLSASVSGGQPTLHWTYDPHAHWYEIYLGTTR